MHLKKLLSKLISLLFPERCICCDKLCIRPYFCSSCQGKVEPIHLKTCYGCGLPKKLCCCKHNFYYFKSVVSCFENADMTQKAFYKYKFYGNRPAGGFFADQMQKTVKQKYSDITFDLVCSVPCHKSAKKQYGFDRVGDLAKELAKALNLRYKNILIQPHKTQKQHKAASAEERFRAVKNKYKTKRNISLTGKTVLLVDDIKTMGATLSECARELKLAGAKEVYCVTALITYPKKKDKSIKS